MSLASETNEGRRAERHSSGSTAIHVPRQQAKRALPPSTQSQTSATLASSPRNAHPSRPPTPPLRALALHLCGSHPSLSALTVCSQGRLDPADSPPADT